MNTRSPRCLALGFIAVAVAALPARGVGAEPPAVALPVQLTRAQAAEDHAAVVELCRRQLDAPGANVPALLATLFHAQVELADFPRAGQTLDRLEKTARRPPAETAEMRGDLALADNRRDDALTAWRAGLAARPADPVPLLGKVADALDADGRWPEAADALRAFLKVRPAHAARRARLAVCLLNTGRAGEADREMLAAVRADAADPTVKAHAPQFDRLRPQLPALRALDARVAAAPAAASPARDVSAGAKTTESARLDRALFFFRAGVMPPALADAAAVSETMGGNSMAARLLQAECLRRLGREDEAVRLRVAKLSDGNWFSDNARFDRLRAADEPRSLNAADTTASRHLARAATLFEADQPVLALEDAEFAARSYAASGQRFFDTEVVLAAAFLRCDRPAEALAAARRATELDPRSGDAWALRGRLEQDGPADLVAALDSLNHALAIREDPRWLRRREICLRTLGRTAEADRDARRLAGLPAS